MPNIGDTSPNRIGEHPFVMFPKPALFYENEFGAMIDIVGCLTLITDKSTGKTFGFVHDATLESDIINIFGKISFTSTINDISDKIDGIMNNMEYDSRVVLTLDLDEKTRTLLHDLSVERNISYDELITMALQDAVDRAEAITQAVETAQSEEKDNSNE